jgi:hypothetical protein
VLLQLQNLCAHDYETALTLNAGTWSAANVLPATYDLPTEMQDMQQWQYGLSFEATRVTP